MQDTSWIELIRLIPPEKHEDLILMTVNGTEISIITILRAEEEYLVLRGRVMGSSDTGRIFFIPYVQINFLCLMRGVTEEDLQAIYEMAQAEAEVAEGEVEPSAAEVAAPEEAPAESAPLSPILAEGQPSPAIRSNLLERLRGRANAPTPPSADK